MAQPSFAFQEGTSLSLDFLETSQEESWTSQSPSTIPNDKPLFGFVKGSEGAQKLYTAILNLAIRDYSMYLNKEDKRQQMAIDAWEWLMSDHESTELTAFVDICRILDQNPALVRAKIAESVDARQGTGTLSVAAST